MVPTTYVVGLIELQAIFSPYIVPIDFAASLQDRKKDMQLFSYGKLIVCWTNLKPGLISIYSELKLFACTDSL
jgi:hypothetical protein